MFLQKSKIYINGELLGSCEDPISFTQEMREKKEKR
jgi:DNA-directed RNA polymerase subunit B'/DNA-directed RNA polymerase subunit B